ncbi:MAG: hypothetical protein IJ859_06280 [Synergistaceae bacterium]|nr:hypothetical protein [Synergistaceae bacterium]
MNAALEEKKSALDYKLDDDNYFDDGEPEPLFDEYGNPTPETLQAFYEIENGLTEKVSFEELMAWANDA